MGEQAKSIAHIGEFGMRNSDKRMRKSNFYSLTYFNLKEKAPLQGRRAFLK
jgi:hypothetical protein